MLNIQTKTVDVDTWNALIFIVTTLITVILGVIAYYQRKNSDAQHELVRQVSLMSNDIAVMKSNSENIKEDVDDIKVDVGKIKDELHDHEKRITRLEVIK